VIGEYHRAFVIVYKQWPDTREFITWSAE